MLKVNQIFRVNFEELGGGLNQKSNSNVLPGLSSRHNSIKGQRRRSNFSVAALMHTQTIKPAVVVDKITGSDFKADALLLVSGCLEGPQTLEQFACQGTELHISCGESSQIHVVDDNYGRLDSSMCALPLYGSSDINCGFNVTCVVTKWLEFYNLSRCYSIAWDIIIYL